MKFLDGSILLESELAAQLYQNYAKDMPIIDYHCHIVQAQVAADKKFRNITELWLAGDHYKWRLMRNCGVSEEFITGGAPDREKFKKFAECLPYCLGNPIYIWCHLELKKYFGLNTEINAENADYIFDYTQEKLQENGMSVKGIIAKSNVEVICTTDDPADDLLTHLALRKQGNAFKVLPTFRPDKALNIENAGFLEYLDALSKADATQINNLKSLKDVLKSRLMFFIENGCRISDHALSGFIFSACGDTEADAILQKAIGGERVCQSDAQKYKTNILLFLAGLYNKHNIVMQLHFSCLRNTNTVMFSKLGADTGFDTVNRSGQPYKLAAFLDALNSADALPKTIVYSLDADDNKLINTIINSFQGGMRGKLQHGSAWWFNDTELGMKDQLRTLCEYGVIGNFVGMLTDSRSFTSYVRHDYFRRILCTVIAEQVNAGKYPKNDKYLKMLVQNICYYNIKNYL